MSMTLLLGGARSGKSALAVKIAREQAAPVEFIATAEALDNEMEERIAAHRAERPDGWRTMEAPEDLAAALRGATPGSCVIVDCLTLWVSNVFARGEAAVVTAAAEAAAAASTREGTTLVVSNEVGSGIVPVDADTRRWRDLLGRVNATFAERAERSFLVVAGRVVPLLAVEDTK